jgi:hypothetical protein
MAFVACLPHNDVVWKSMNKRFGAHLHRPWMAAAAKGSEWSGGGAHGISRGYKPSKVGLENTMSTPCIDESGHGDPYPALPTYIHHRLT